MSSAPMEYASAGMQAGEWKLEPGTYEVRGSKVHRISDAAKNACDEAAERFITALRRVESRGG